MIFPARVGNPSREEYAVLMNCILALAILGALGICFGWGGFTSLAFLWQLPLLFATLWLGLVLLAFLFLIQFPWTGRWRRTAGRPGVSCTCMRG